MQRDKQHIQYTKILSNVYLKDFIGYRLDQMLFTEADYVYDHTSLEVLKITLKSLYSTRFNTSYKSRGSRGILLYTYYYRRKDHDNNWNELRSLLHHFAEYEVKDVENLVPLSFITRFMRLVRYIKALRNIPNYEDRLYLAIRLLELFDLKINLERDLIPDNKNKILFTFFDGGFHENIAVQFAKLHGMVTVTLQHGQPLFKGGNYDRLNQTVILNCISDYTICAGEFSKLQYIKAGVDESRLVVLGSLKNKMEPDISYKNIVLNKNICVFLDTPGLVYSNETNRLLINYANDFCEKTGYGYYLKAHPNDDNNYANIIDKKYFLGAFKKNDTIEKLHSEIAIGIMHTSSIFTDMINNFIRPFKLVTKYPFDITEDKSSLFHDTDELIQKVYKWVNLDDELKELYFKEQIKYYNCDNAEENHVNFIDSLLEKS